MTNESQSRVWQQPTPPNGSVAQLWVRLTEQHARLQRMYSACRAGGPNMADAIAHIEEKMAGLSTDCDETERLCYELLMADLDEAFVRFIQEAMDHMVKRDRGLVATVAERNAVERAQMNQFNCRMGALNILNAQLQAARDRTTILHKGIETLNFSHDLYRDLRKALRAVAGS